MRLTLFFLFAHGVNAQEFINPRFSRFTINEGLSQSLVYAITQDKKGFMWFGTKDGLNRFDGYDFTIYHHDPFDSTSLSDNTITTLFSDSKGRLWIGTQQGGLNLYDRDNDHFNHIESPNLNDANIHAITEDSSGNLWLGTYGNGLFKISFNHEDDDIPDSIVQYLHQSTDPASLCGNLIIDVFIDNKDRLWVSTTSGPFQYANPGENKIRFQFPHYHTHTVPKKIIPDGAWYDPTNSTLTEEEFKYFGGRFAEDQQGRLWIGLPGGLSLLDEQAQKLLIFNPVMPGLDQRIVRSVHRVNQGGNKKQNTLWAGFFGGLGIFNTTDFTMQFIENDPGNSRSLLPGVVQSIYQDSSGSVWVGSNGHGLSKYDARTTKFLLPNFHTFDGKVRTENLSIRSFLDTPNFLLIGSTSGLWKADNSTHVMYKVNLARTPGAFNQIFHIIDTEEGNVWLATNSGLVQYQPDNDQSTLYSPDISRDGETDNRVFKLYNDSRGGVWCLTPYTFSYFDKSRKTFTHYFYSQSRINRFSEPAYGDIHQDEKGDYWFGSGEGLIHFERSGNTFRYFVNIPTDTNSLSLNSVRCVLPDPIQPDNYLWVATAGGGLNKFDILSGKFSHLTIEDGLPNNVVYGILPDEIGHLWLSTNKGISQFDPVTGKFQNFTVQSGLQSNEFNSGAFYKNKHGKLFFGGISGFNTINPKEMTADPYIPPVVFTGLRLSNHKVSIKDKNSPIAKPISETQSIVLPYYENSVGLQAAGLDYSHIGQIQYEYKLENIDDTWISMGTNRVIAFSNLASGAYVLRVRTVTGNELQNHREATMKIFITPPWWKTWWAYILYFMILLSLLYFLRKHELKRVYLRNNLKLKNIEAQKLSDLDQLKSRFFANISHEFRTPLTLLLGPLEDAMEGGDPGKLTALVPEMHRNTRRLMQLINQLLDLSRLDTGKHTINTSRQDIIPFVCQFVKTFLSLAERKNITLEADVESDLRKIINEGQNIFFFDEDIIEKILSNLLSNAFKFTPYGGEIKVGLAIHDNNPRGLELRVEDNGSGMPEESISHIFDRFYQIDSSIKQSNEGSGIGLSLVKELVELHEGRVEVESRLQKGSTFTCFFPFDKKIINHPHDKSLDKNSQKSIFNEDDIDIPTAVDPLPQNSGKLHILVVEDHMDVRNYIVQKLHQDYHITEARNGKEGLEAALLTIPDLVISDVRMPGMDGFELCTTLKSDDRSCHIPVILLTARAEDKDRITGLETGADAYLIKPFNSKELHIRIQKLIELRIKLRSKFSDQLVVKPSEITVTSRDRVFMQNILSVVEFHIDDAQFSVEDLGREVHMSRSQINRKLKALINQSPQQFIQSVRMQRAMELLKKDAAIISEVSFKVGYEDPGYFTKVFKKHFGFLPSDREKF